MAAWRRGLKQPARAGYTSYESILRLNSSTLFTIGDGQ